MNWLEVQTRNTPAPELILHLGAGLCHELPLWQESGAGRIVLVEPNPELLPELRQRTEDMDQVEIIDAAVAPESGRGNLRLFNFPLLSSLRGPTGLYQVLPGLRQVGQAMVDLLTMQQLLQTLSLGEDQDNWLVVDAPGEEAEILQQLEHVDRLQMFSRVLLTAGAGQLYQDAESAAQVASRLESLGYQNIGPVDQTDADWPRYHLRLDRMALECDRLRAELAQTRENHKSELEATRQKLEQAEKESAAGVEKVEAALAEKAEAASKLQSQLEQLQSRLSAAETELKSTQQKNQDLQQACRKLGQDNARKEELIDEEFLKAESQLELIKELVFRDKKV